LLFLLKLSKYEGKPELPGIDLYEEFGMNDDDDAFQDDVAEGMPPYWSGSTAIDGCVSGSLIP
jgi:hypothetical protein